MRSLKPSWSVGPSSLAASDYSHREIADKLDMGVRAVNNALQRAPGAELGERLAA